MNDVPLPCPRTASSLFSTQVEKPPSCIEFCPSTSEYLVIGTYLLVEESDTRRQVGEETTETSPSANTAAATQSRSGSLILMNIDPTTGAEIARSTTDLDCAVFDLHFHPQRHNLLTIATSLGKIGFFTWQMDPVALRFESWLDVYSDESVLVTSLNWSPTTTTIGRHPTDLTFIVTYSNGAARVYSIEARDWKPTTSSQFLQLSPHSQEAWYAAFSPDGRLAFTGGDDMVLAAYDYNRAEGWNPDLEVSRIWSDSRAHGAGVTSILPVQMLPDYPDQDVVLTGSYDEFIRVFTMDSFSKRRLEAEERLDGGVWRLKQIAGPWTDEPSPAFSGTRSNLLVLASCMHAGVRILHIMRLCPRSCSHRPCTWTIDVVAKFEEHKSMNYASDVRIVHGRPLVVSTSFYDRLLCVWPLEHWSMGLHGRSAIRRLDGLDDQKGE